LSFEFGRILPHRSAAGPGYPLQFLSPPQAGLRDFRFYPLRGSVSGTALLWDFTAKSKKSNKFTKRGMKAVRLSFLLLLL
jgi:hypothetical protein